MALIKFNQIAAASGSVNGTTYSRNYTGAYMRNRTVPVNPNTESQQEARSFMSIATARWAVLTQEQRNAWAIYAAQTPVVNKVGDTVHLKGNNFHAGVAAFALAEGASLSTTDAAPPIPGVAAAASSTDIEITDAQDLNITFDTPATAPANSAVWISNPVGPGTKYYSGPWNRMTATPTGVWPSQVYGTLPIPVLADQFIFVRLRYRDVDNRLSAPAILGPFGVVAAP